MSNDVWDEKAMRLIHEASELIKPGEGEAVFYIRVGGPHTQCTVKAAAGVDPAKVIHAAIDALNKEFADLKNCPVHTPQPSELEAEVKRLTALAGDHFRNARRLSEVVVARDAQIAKLQADGDKLAGAAEPFVENMAYLDWLEAADDDYVDRPTKSAGDYRRLFQALTACKDRA